MRSIKPSRTKEFYRTADGRGSAADGRSDLIQCRRLVCGHCRKQVALGAIGTLSRPIGDEALRNGSQPSG